MMGAECGMEDGDEKTARGKKAVKRRRKES